MNTKMFAQYIWLDQEGKIRTKSKVIYDSIKEWSFDGSSTNQSETSNSDLVLKPVSVFHHSNPLVLCEVMNQDGTPHASNFRHKLVQELKIKDILVGFEQEYVLVNDENLPFVNKKQEQGKFYCSHLNYGWQIMEEHAKQCMQYGIKIYGTNSEVMPCQHEYQLCPLNPVEACDQLILSRYLLEKIASQNNVCINYDPKLLEHYNGSGLHTNISTDETRQSLSSIYDLIHKLEKSHSRHMKSYGVGNEKRLIGKHETSSYDKFTFGELNRNSSVRIPVHVLKEGKGYLEDRRPAANADPYQVCLELVKTIQS